MIQYCTFVSDFGFEWTDSVSLGQWSTNFANKRAKFYKNIREKPHKHKQKT